MGKTKQKLKGDGPGSYSCHEALHMASFLERSVYEELVQHNAIANNPEWMALALTAGANLQKLYQAIGEAHI